MTPLGSVRLSALTHVAAWGWRILVSLRARRRRLDPHGARLTSAGLRPTITGSECMSNHARGGVDLRVVLVCPVIADSKRRDGVSGNRPWVRVRR